MLKEIITAPIRIAAQIPIAAAETIAGITSNDEEMTSNEINSIADVITAPVRIAAGIPMAAGEAAIGIGGAVLDRFQDKKSVLKGDDGSEASLYDIGVPNLNLCSMIYYYTEIRSETKKRVKEFAEKKNLSYKVGSEPSDLQELYMAIKENERCIDELEKLGDQLNDLKNFRESVVAIKTLKEKLHLSDGDIKILEQYFFILDLQPKLTDIKKCFELFSDYTTPQFRLAFGGTEFNIRQIENLVRLDDSSYIHYIDDDFTSTSLDVKGFINGFDSEIVYAIAVSDKTRTITVVFRGSSNLNDWLTNIQVHFTDCVVPGFTSEEEMKSIERISIGNVHNGFYKYLFEETEEGKNGSTKSKGEDIVGMLKDLVEGEKQGYRIFFTGHSLGGALSTLMAARCAALNDFNSTLINVSIASPFVGDQEFRDCFYEWERSRKIQHLRISNYEDIVPLIPSWSLLPFPRPYKHTGMHIKLYNKSLIHRYNYLLSYPKKDSIVNEVRSSLNTNLLNGFNLAIFNHFCTEYSERMENAKEDLMEMNLTYLYSDPDRTGWEYKDIEEDKSPEAAAEQ